MLFFLRKRFAITALAALLALCFSLTVQARTIRIGLSMPRHMTEIDYLNGMYVRFKEIVERESGGDLKVQIYFGGVLGKPDERLNQVRRNIIQMSDASDGNYATIFRDIQVISIPYLFPNREVAHNVLDGEFGKLLADKLRMKTNIRVLGWWESAGFKHYSANKPMRVPADFRGQKMRVMSAVFSLPVIAMGGSAIPVPMPELYISLKTGVVNGQDNAVAVFNILKLHEVQEYLVLDSHIYSFGPLAINETFFATLSSREKRIVESAALNVVKWNRRRSMEQETAAIKTALSHGVKIIHLSSTEKQALKNITQPVAIDWMKNNIDTPALVDMLVDEVKTRAAN